MANSKTFEQKKFCIVKNAISEELRDYVTQYALFDEMQNSIIGDEQVPNAHSKYADPAMETMLLHLLPIMKENTGLDLIPTYSYYRVYRNGDDLKKHQDRPSCEISCTLCFNFDYDSKKYKWPIYMDGNSVLQDPGDLVIYRGCDLVHWRDSLDYPEETWQVQGFFHYIDANGPYAAEHKFDGRDSVGALKEPKQAKTISNKSYITYL
jgi:hypothetical protein